MLKRALIVVGIFAFAAVARADMTVDGDISDWPSALIQTDGSNDNAGSEAEMLRWGAIMTGGNLYGFIQSAHFGVANDTRLIATNEGKSC